MPGLGEAIKGGTPGDLYVKIHVKAHPTFRKEGLNLVMQLPLKLTDALLGTTVMVNTIDDKTLDYLRLTGREEEQIALVEAYAREQGFWVSADAPEPIFSSTLGLDMATVVPSLAGRATFLFTYPQRYRRSCPQRQRKLSKI